MTGLNRVLVLAVAIVAFCWGCSSSETFSPTPEGIAQYLARNGLGFVDTSGTPWELDRIPREECALAFPDPFDSSKDFMLILPNKYGILTDSLTTTIPTRILHLSLSLCISQRKSA